MHGATIYATCTLHCKQYRSFHGDHTCVRHARKDDMHELEDAEFLMSVPSSSLPHTMDERDDPRIDRFIFVFVCAGL